MNHDLNFLEYHPHLKNKVSSAYEKILSNIYKLVVEKTLKI